jgi:hypothetical protein
VSHFPEEAAVSSANGEIRIRPKPYTLAKLKEMAARENLSLPDLVIKIVAAYLGTQQDDDQAPDERRKFRRKPSCIPAVVHMATEEGMLYTGGTVADISFGGIRVTLVGERVFDTSVLEKVESMEILFKIPGCDIPVVFKCRPCRVEPVDGHISIGAAFTDAAVPEQQALYGFLNNP